MAPFDRLAQVELQIVMQHCDQATLLALARCSRTTLAAASQPFAWRALSPLRLECKWPLDLSTRLSQSSLLRHRPQRRRPRRRLVPGRPCAHVVC